MVKYKFHDFPVRKPSFVIIAVCGKQIPDFPYYKTRLYLFFSVFGATYNQNLKDVYLIDKCFTGVFCSSASSIQKRLIIAKIQ